MISRPYLLAAATALLTPAATPFAASLGAQQALDSAYTARIRELTPVDPRYKFTTELVDHLPASRTVPTPLQVLRHPDGLRLFVARQTREVGSSSFLLTDRELLMFTLSATDIGQRTYLR